MSEDFFVKKKKLNIDCYTGRYFCLMFFFLKQLTLMTKRRKCIMIKQHNVFI